MRILITAGGTREYIDPVRFISNASSGRMGIELARAAFNAGHKVTLIATVPCGLQLRNKARIIQVENASEMFEAVKKHFVNCDCLIMSAAVADYTPVKKSKVKIKKQNNNLTIKFKTTRDILKWAGMNKNIKRKNKNRMVVGFALEDDNLLENAERKLKEKKLDMIIANDISAIGNKKSSVYIKIKNLPWLEFVELSKKITSRRIIKLIGDLT